MADHNPKGSDDGLRRDATHGRDGRSTSPVEKMVPRSRRPAGGHASANRDAAAGRGAKSLDIVPASTPSDPAQTASTASDTAGGALRKPTAKNASKSLDAIAAGAVGGAVRKAVEGDGSSAVRRGAGRYAGAAASGAVVGARAGAAAGGVGALPAAAIGAAKNVGLEAGKDAVDGVAAVAGGGPDAEPADKRLGAGGTGYERGQHKDEQLLSKTAKGVVAGGAAVSAPPALGLVMLMALLKWLKTMFFMMLATAANAGNLAWGILVGIAKAVGHAVAAPFMAIGGLVGKAAGAVFGVAVTAAVAPAATAASGAAAMLTAVAVLSTVITGVVDQGAYDEGHGSATSNCIVTAGSSGQGAKVPATTDENARAVYSVLKTLGMPDENIAGILGNWSQESGIDPTSVEGISDEPYQIGPRKKTAWDGGFTHIPGQSHGGIGLGQWSNGRTPMLLDYAKSKGLDWYTIKAQLAFMLEGDSPSDVTVFKDMVTKSQGSPGDAARYFHEEWERSADNASQIQERVDDAQMWYAEMSGWSVDRSAAEGVKEIVGGIVDTVGGGIRSIFGNCDDGTTSRSGGLVDGGMDEHEAQQLVDLYNEEGDKFLDEKYGSGGGPGSCGDNHAMNCVSLSVYFMNKYTSFQEYPTGDGIQTAHSIASMTGKQVSSTPTAYSVGSGPGSGSAGHTLVVLGVEGDRVIVGEAGYCAFMGRVRVDSADRMKAEGWVFVDVSDLIAKDGGKLPT
jgi:hypothetical protein